MKTSKTAFLAFVCAATLMGYLPHAAAVEERASTNRIECTEWSNPDGDSQAVSVVKVHLDAQGNADEVSITRVKTESEPAMKAELNKDNAKITHEIIKHEPDNFNITEVETIVATDKAGNSIRLNLNDHTYAGNPGSSMEVSRDGKSFSTMEQGNLFQCKGHFRLDNGAAPSENELLE